MKHKTLLLVTERRISVWQWRSNGCSAPQHFDNTPSAQDQLRHYFRQHAAPVWMLADLTEEEFIYEGLPHINDLDHRAAALMRLATLFPGTPLRMVIKQLRQSKTGEDDEMLYSALTRPERLEPWLEIIASLHIPLAGIYSVAHLCRFLLQDNSLECQLLVTLNAGAGLRTSCLMRNKLRFSRLSASHQLAERVWAEAYQTRPYLYNRRLLQRAQPLPVTVLCQRSAWEALQQSAPPDPELPLHHLDIIDIARQLGMTSIPEDSDATPLFLHLLATQPPEFQYATEEMTRNFRQRNLRRVLYTLVALIGLAGMVLGAINLWQAQHLQADARHMQQQFLTLSTQAKRVQADLPPLPVPAADMQHALSLLRSLDQTPSSTLLVGISRALDACPLVTLLKLEWQPAMTADTPSSIVLHLTTNDAPPESLIQFRHLLVGAGYQVSELHSGDGHLPATWQLLTQAEE